jgi:hypothetical protein
MNLQLLSHFNLTLFVVIFKLYLSELGEPIAYGSIMRCIPAYCNSYLRM